MAGFDDDVAAGVRHLQQVTTGGRFSGDRGADGQAGPPGSARHSAAGGEGGIEGHPTLLLTSAHQSRGADCCDIM